MGVGMFAIVEIMGHRTRAGLISDAQLGGATLLRIEHPTRVDVDQQPIVEYYTPQAIFAIRPCSQGDAETAAGWSWPEQRVTPALGPAFADVLDDDDDDDPDDF